jgi:hypothetical protein
MESSKLFQAFGARPQKQMIGIPQQDLHAHRIQFLGQAALDRALGTHGHENRGLDDAMRQGHPRTSGLGSPIGFDNFKIHALTNYLQKSP